MPDDKQEWEVCDIIGKEDVDGVLHYWVQWSATLVPKCEMGKARALIARFETGLRAQRKCCEHPVRSATIGWNSNA